MISMPADSSRARNSSTAERNLGALFPSGRGASYPFSYDFRRTEMCIIPYATQEGEISFCAYNTGVGWRQIVEKMHLTATLAKWYETYGRHEIFAAGKSVPLPSTEHSLSLDTNAVDAPAQTDLDSMNIPKTAREEMARFIPPTRSRRKAHRSNSIITPPPKAKTPERAC